MPFATGARIEIENDTGQTIDAFYYYVDYTELASLAPDLGRFHAWYNHQLTEAPPEGENEWSTLGEQGKNTTGDRNYLIADIVGKGHYVGVNYSSTSRFVSRSSMPPITEVDIHKWRHEWRKSKGSRPTLWGNEKEK